jgi:hypothetical protein
MVVPYIVEEDGQARCLCIGCGETLWRTIPTRDGGRETVISADRYGDLYLAMTDPQGVLSQHSHPTCPSCAAKALAGEVDLEEWWAAIVLHWFVEERVRGQDPDASYRVARRLEGERRPVRALRYTPREAA